MYNLDSKQRAVSFQCLQFTVQLISSATSRAWMKASESVKNEGSACLWSCMNVEHKLHIYQDVFSWLPRDWGTQYVVFKDITPLSVLLGGGQCGEFMQVSHEVVCWFSYSSSCLNTGWKCVSCGGMYCYATVWLSLPQMRFEMIMLMTHLKRLSLTRFARHRCVLGWLKKDKLVLQTVLPQLRWSIKLPNVPVIN